MSQSFQIKETENQGLKRAYEVIVSAAYIDNKVNEELKKLGSRVKLPGFRTGKIPLEILKKRYKQNTLADVINNAVDDATREALKKHSIVPALRPEIKGLRDYQEDGDLEFAITLEIMPESPVIAFEELEVTKPVIKVSEEEVEKSLKRLAEGKRDVKERAASAKAKEGDVVVIDFKGFLGDEAFEGGEGKNYSLELGSGQFIPGFEEQIIGKKAGETFDIHVTFPADYHSADLAGKETRFAIDLHKVQEVIYPEINDELAKQFGHDSVDSLKEFVRTMLLREYQPLIRNYQKKQLFDALDERCQFDVPEKMLELEFNSIWQQAVQEAQGRGENEADMEHLREDYQRIANRRVRLGILLSQTAGRNNVQVTQQDMQQAIMAQARMYQGQERKVIEFFQKNPDAVQELRGPVLEEKAVDFVLGKVKIVEVEKTFEQLLKEEEESNDASSATKEKKAASKSTSAKKKAASESKSSDTDASEAEAGDNEAAAAKKPKAKTATKKKD